MLIREQFKTIAARIPEIETACNFVAEEAGVAGMGDEAVYHCRISTEEIITNVIEHGYAGTPGTIDVVCRHETHAFYVTVIDDAPAFDPLSLPDPDPLTPLWERQGGGWGFYFVKKFMDSVRYARSNNRNTLTLEKRL